MEKQIYDNQKEIFYKVFSEINTLDKYEFIFIDKVEYKLIFENNRKRRLSIELFDDYFFVKMYNTKNKEDFLLENWLENYGLDIKPNPFLWDSYKGTFKERLLSFKNYLENVFLEDKMDKILMGEYWWKEKVDPYFTFIP